MKQMGKQIHVALPVALRKRLQTQAEKEKRSVAYMVREALENYLDAIQGGTEDEKAYTPAEKKALGLKQRSPDP